MLERLTDTNVRVLEKPAPGIFMAASAQQYRLASAGCADSTAIDSGPVGHLMDTRLAQPKDFLVSVRPEYAAKILDGEKT
jgi:hypothetical protein